MFAGLLSGVHYIVRCSCSFVSEKPKCYNRFWKNVSLKILAVRNLWDWEPSSPALIPEQDSLQLVAVTHDAKLSLQHQISHRVTIHRLVTVLWMVHTALTVWRGKWRSLGLWGCERLAATLSAEPGSVFSLARRRACKRWKTRPRAGWLFEQSRRTPKATESWRVKSCEARKGYGGMWRNVLSACHRGEPAQLWAGKDTLLNWKGRHFDQNTKSTNGNKVKQNQHYVKGHFCQPCLLIGFESCDRRSRKSI